MGVVGRMQKKKNLPKGGREGGEKRVQRTRGGQGSNQGPTAC